MDLNSHFWTSTPAFKLLTRTFKLSTRNLQLVTRVFYHITIITLFSSYKNQKETCSWHSNHSENNFKVPPTLWMQKKFYGWVHVTTNCFYFNLNVLKFELQYKWIPPQIFFCEYCVSQLLFHSGEGAHDIKCNQTGTEILLISETCFSFY